MYVNVSLLKSSEFVLIAQKEYNSFTLLHVRGDIIHKGLDMSASKKMNEALIKSMYRAAFDFITEKINLSINAGNCGWTGGASTSKGRDVLNKSLSGVDAGAGASIVPLGRASIGVLGECFVYVC